MLRRPLITVMLVTGVFALIISGGQIAGGEWSAIWKWGLAGGTVAILAGGAVSGWDMLRLRNVLLCMVDVFVASFAALPIYTLNLLFGGYLNRSGPTGYPADRWTALFVGYMWLITLACGEVLVVPVAALIPEARRPRPLAAVAWGVAIAWISSATLLGLGPGRPWWNPIYGLAGGLSGGVYALLARRRPR
jgi:hypothetical protein